MPDAQALIIEAGELIGAFQQGETPNATELTRGLNLLNSAVIDAFKNDRLMAYSVGPVSQTLIGSQRIYTYGSGGDFNATRPAFIQGARIVNYWELDQLNADQYRAIRQPLIEGIPEKMFDDGGYPLRKLYFHYVPSGSLTVELYPWITLQPFAGLGTIVDVPPGYYEVLLYNLALKMADPFGMPVSDPIVAQATGAVAKVRQQNALLIPGAIDPTQVSGAPARGLPQAAA